MRRWSPFFDQDAFIPYCRSRTEDEIKHHVRRTRYVSGTNTVQTGVPDRRIEIDLQLPRHKLLR